MNDCILTLCGNALKARATGTLWWPDEAVLTLSDLHLGKAERIARRSGLMLPPWEAEATLDRLEAEVDTLNPRTVICLGDSFDDLAAAEALPEAVLLRLSVLMAGRRWIWISGNHDPGPVDLGGTHLAEVRIGTLTFRHEAVRQTGTGAAPGDPPVEAGSEMTGEVSGHYHPKLALPGTGGARPCFLADRRRLIMPAFGSYTGGLSARDPVLQSLFRPPALAILTGPRAIRAPFLAETAGGAAPARNISGPDRTGED